MMRASRFLGALTAAVALTALPALGQGNSTDNAAPTLTPPGSTTPVPILPNANPAAAVPNVPSVPLGSTLPMTTTAPGGLPMSGTGLNDIFSGASSVPMSLKLGDLTPAWKRMTITGSLDLGVVTQVVTSLLGSAGVGVYFTQGQTVTLGNTTYLVTYRTQPKIFDMTSLMQMAQTAAMTSKPPSPEKLTPQTPLALTLLNLQSAGSLTDVRPFDLSRELADSANAVQAYNEFLNLIGAPATAPRPAPRLRVKPHSAT